MRVLLATHVILLLLASTGFTIVTAFLGKVRFATISSDSVLDLQGLEGLQQLEQLEQLSLHAKEIEDLRPLYGLQQLHWVAISDTAVPPAELDAFRDARPDIQLEISPQSRISFADP